MSTPMIARAFLPFGLARAALFVCVALIPVVFWRGALEPFESCKIALLHLTALVVAACLVAGRTSTRLWREPLGLAMLASFVAACVSAAFSISVRTSICGTWESYQGLLTLGSLLTLFVAARAVLIEERDFRSVVVALAIGVTICAAYACVQVAKLDPFAWTETSEFAGYTRPIGTMGHPNYLAGLLVMALPPFVWLWRTQQWRVMLLPIALAILVVVLSLSRAAWLSALTLLPLALVWLRPRWRWVVIGCVIVSLVVASIGTFGPIGERLRSIASSDSRLEIWRISVNMFLDQPLTGSGIDTYQLAFTRHRTTRYWELEWGMTPTHAHNEPLHLLATQGMLGGLGYILLLAATIVTCVRAWRRWPARRGIVVTLAGVCLAYHVQNLLGFPVMATACLHAVALGVLARTTCEVEPIPKSVSPGWFILSLLATLVVAYPVVYCPLLAQCLIRAGQQDPDQTHGLVSFKAAVAQAPWLDMAHAHLACARHRVGQLHAATNAAAWARDLVPASATYHTTCARLELDLARREGANHEDVWRAFDAALVRDPRNPLIRLDAARAAIALGRFDLAREHLDQVRPDMAERTAERGILEFAEGNLSDAKRLLREAIDGDWHGRRDALGRAHAMLGLVCLQSDEANTALVQADTVLLFFADLPSLEPTARYVRASALERLGHVAEAREDFKRVLALRPDHAQAREGVARLEQLPFAR